MGNGGMTMLKNKKMKLILIIMFVVFAITFNLGVFSNPNFDIYDFCMNLSSEIIGLAIALVLVDSYVNEKKKINEQPFLSRNNDINYQVEIREIEPVRVAYMTHKGQVTLASALFPTVFQSVGGEINNIPFFIYHEMDAHTMQGVVDVCEPSAEEPDNPAVKIKVVPGVRALVAQHTGPYDTIYMAYQAINRYAAENGLKLTGPSREIFVKGPNVEENPANFVTIVVVPVE